MIDDRWTDCPTEVLKGERLLGDGDSVPTLPLSHLLEVATH